MSKNETGGRSRIWAMVVIVVLMLGGGVWTIVEALRETPAEVPGRGGAAAVEEPAPRRVMTPVEVTPRAPVSVAVAPPEAVTNAHIRFAARGTLRPPLAMMPGGGQYVIVRSEINRERGQGTIDSLVLMDAATGVEAKVITGPSDKDEYQFRTAALSADGKLALTGNFYGWARLWNVETGAEIAQWKEGRIIETVAFSPDGRRFATGGYGSNGPPVIEVYDVERKEKVATLAGHEGGFYVQIISRVAFLPDGKRLVSAGQDRTVRIWDIDSKKELFVMEGHTQPVHALAVSANGGRIASGGGDGRLCVWDSATGKLLRRMREPENDRGNRSINDACFVDDGKRLLWRGINGVKLMDVDTGQILATFSAYGSGIFELPEGRFMTSSGVWQIPNWLTPAAGAFLPEDPDPPLAAVRVIGPPAREVVPNVNEVQAAVLLNGGKEMMAAYSGGLMVKWEVATGKELSRVSLKASGGGGIVMALSADGRLAAVAASMEKLSLIDAASGEEVRAVAAGMTYNAAFTPDGKHLLVSHAPRQDDGFKADITVHEVASGELVRTLAGSTGLIWGLMVTPDGKRVLSGGNAGAVSDENTPSMFQVWDFATGELVHRLQGHSAAIGTIATTPDGKRAITGAKRGGAIVWDMDSAREVVRLTEHLNRNGYFRTNVVALSSDGRFAATGGADNDIRIFDLANGAEIRRFEMHKGPLKWLSFLPGDRQVISAASDGTIRVWDAR